jgi:hypothetical protein
MMKTTPKQANHFLNPYIFILKEGKQIQENYLDYSLLLLKIGQVTVLPSPHRAKNYRPLIQVQVNRL